MFHAVNGDRGGNGWAQPVSAPTLPIDLPQTNKGDRGYSDQMEARTFLIGNPSKER